MEEIRISERTAAVIRKHFPVEQNVVALYDADGLTRPSLPVITYPGSQAMEALQHAWDRGRLAVAVYADGRIVGHESGPPYLEGQTGWSHEELMAALDEVGRGAPPDGKAIAEAVRQYWIGRDESEAEIEECVR